MSEQQQEPSPSTLVDQALDECIEETRKGFGSLEYDENDLDRLRASLREDFRRLLDTDKGEHRWERDGPRLRLNCLGVGTIAHIAAEVADRSKIETKDVRDGLEFVINHCTLDEETVSMTFVYCTQALAIWDSYKRL